MRPPLCVFTNGDIRRCIESEIELTTKVKNLKFTSLLNIKSQSKVSLELNIVRSNNISILPIVDDYGLLLGSEKFSQFI